MIKEIANLLLDWYEKNKRDLPWRADRNPYHIWISEIMLQQTRVEAVKGYYTRFLKEAPTIYDLSIIDEDRLLKLWEGLGYYNRARNLKKAANVIMKDYNGKMPSTYFDLLSLPGIGEYTAGAIASIAFNEKVCAVDGNVLRVITRIMNDYSNIDLPKTKKDIYKKVFNILPEETGTFNQSLMELGATICIPNGTPLCNHCPIQPFCLSYQSKTTDMIPVRNKKSKRKIVSKTILLFVSYEKVAIQKRSSKGLLANLYEFPNVDELLTIEDVRNYLKEKNIDALKIIEVGTAKHIFTHIEWHMTGYLIYIGDINQYYDWINYDSLMNQYAIPSAFEYYKDILIEQINKKL